MTDVLREALERIAMIADGQVTQYARAREQVARIAHEALASALEPQYEYRACASYGTDFGMWRSGPTSDEGFARQMLQDVHATGAGYIERRTAPGEWERVPDGDPRWLAAEQELSRMEGLYSTAVAERDRLREREHHFVRVLGVADGGQYRNDWDARIRALVAERDRYREALERVRDREWVENVRDPQWAVEVAREVLDFDRLSRP